MSEEIPEIGDEEYRRLRRELRFGDIIENGWASFDNPRRFGIVIKPRAHSIMCTDGQKDYWDLIFYSLSKIKVHGNVLNDNYEKTKKTHERNNSNS